MKGNAVITKKVSENSTRALLNKTSLFSMDVMMVETRTFSSACGTPRSILTDL